VLHNKDLVRRAREWLGAASSVAAPLSELLPRCGCGGLLRPGVVWFGERLPAQEWREAEEATSSADLFLVVGTAAVVYPAAGLVMLAKASGARVIEINMDETPFSATLDCSLRGSAGALLPQVIGAAESA